MRPTFSLSRLSLLLLGLGCLPALAQTSLEGRVIVRWKADAPTVKAKALHERAAQHEVADLMQRRADSLGQRAALRVSSGRALDARTQVVFAQGIDSASLAKRLAMDPQVELVAVDKIRRHSRVPNDTLYAGGAGVLPASGQWYLRPPGNGVASSINAEAAWDRSTGSASIVVAVLDTGVRLDHPDLAANLVPGYDMIGAGGSGSSRIAVANDGDLADADPSDPGDWVSQADINGGALGSGCTSSDISSSSWHGTRVAGLIGAVSDNGLGMAGVSWAGKIQPIRVLGKCGGFDSDILAGVRWAAGVAVPGLPANATPARVLNLSLGSTGPCTGATGQLYRDAFGEANARGAVVVVAAGNSAGEPVDSPGNCTGALAVTGLRHVGTKVGFSSMGPEVAIAAPGGNCVNLSGACLYPMVSTTNAGSQAPGANTYTFGSASVGTSFATPLVAGTVALMLSVDPTLTPAQVRTLMQQTARPFPTTGGGAPDDVTPPPNCPVPVSGTEVLECYCSTTTCGAGMLDARAVMAAINPPPPPPPPPPAPAPSSGGGGSSSPLWLAALGLATALLRRRR